jgi:elongation factor P--beta-lysine ligase
MNASKLTPFVNTDIKMPKKLFDALTLHEVSCCAQEISIVTPESVQAFLTERFTADLAAKFKPEYLISSPSF